MNRYKTTWRSAMRIASIELNVMFYSPVAWLVIAVFAFQVGWVYSDLLNGLIHQQSLGEELSAVTGKLFGKADFWGTMSGSDLFSNVANYLYLYMPLMTMGLLSREYSSGSIRLVFSSPVSNLSIVLGKFIAIMSFGLVLLLIVAGYVVYSGCVIEHFDWGHAFAGLIGLFLLLGCYASIGLFMSSLTVYPVVAAIGTLALLAVLNYIGGVGQSIGFIRDITYWLALSGKTREFILGLIPSESVIYFLSLIVFFLYATWLHLGDLRMRKSRKLMCARYAGAVGGLILLAWFSSRPSCKLYADWTAVDDNTLSEESQEAVNRVDGPLKITTYVNMLDVYVWGEVLPEKIKEDMKRFERYTRFKPEIEMEYVYYWDEAGNEYLKKQNPGLSNRELAEKICRANGVDFDDVLSPDEIRKQIDLTPYGNHVVRLFERGNGQREFLPIYTDHRMHAGEKEITAVFKRLAGECVKVAFVEGHSDWSIFNQSTVNSYWWHTLNFFDRRSLVANGFDVQGVYLNTDSIPDDIDVLVMPPLNIPLDEEETVKVERYVRDGGNLFLLAENGTQEQENVILNKLGINLSASFAACRSVNPTVIQAEVADEALSFIPGLERITNKLSRVVQKDVAAIDYSKVKDYKVVPIVQSPAKGVWMENETKEIGEDSVLMNADAGEKEGRYAFLVALEKKHKDGTQRILVGTDSDWFSSENVRFMSGVSAINSALQPLLMRWFSDGIYPVLAEHPSSKDNKVYLASSVRKYNTLVMVGLVPGLVLLAGLFLVRKRMRA